MNKNKRYGPLSDHPSRQDMVSAAILMERSGFSWSEWSVMLQLCDSELQIRQYILAYVKDCLNMWDGLAPSRGRFCYEIAAIAASNAWVKARKEMRNYPREYVQKLMEPPEP